MLERRIPGKYGAGTPRIKLAGSCWSQLLLFSFWSQLLGRFARVLPAHAQFGRSFLVFGGFGRSHQNLAKLVCSLSGNRPSQTETSRS